MEAAGNSLMSCSTGKFWRQLPAATWPLKQLLYSVLKCSTDPFIKELILLHVKFLVFSSEYRQGRHQLAADVESYSCWQPKLLGWGN